MFHKNKLFTCTLLNVDYFHIEWKHSTQDDCRLLAAVKTLLKLIFLL